MDFSQDWGVAVRESWGPCADSDNGYSYLFRGLNIPVIRKYKSQKDWEAIYLFNAKRKREMHLRDKAASHWFGVSMDLDQDALKKEFHQARPYVEYYYPALATAMYESGLFNAFVLNPDRVELLKYYILVDKESGEVHDISRPR